MQHAVQLAAHAGMSALVVRSMVLYHRYCAVQSQGVKRVTKVQGKQVQCKVGVVSVYWKVAQGSMQGSVMSASE
jgi:hypothetical protein